MRKMATVEMTWKSCSDELPPEGIVVNTKIDDGDGMRNEGILKRQGRLWFTPDGRMYVYYVPTHWHAICPIGFGI